MREDRLLPYLRVEVCGARPCGGPPRAEASARAALSAAMLQQGIVTARQDAVLIAWRLLLPSLIRIFG